jgi:hypothetical protein
MLWKMRKLQMFGWLSLCFEGAAASGLRKTSGFDFALKGRGFSRAVKT